MIDIVSIISFVISFLAAIIVWYLEYLAIKKKHASDKEIPPGERMQKSISKLSSASQEIDNVIQDIINDIENRRIGLEELKIRHQTLLQEEKELSKRVEMLKDLPIEVANYFQQISEQTLQTMEKRKAKRDITMFSLGILVTTVISIFLRITGF